MKMKRTELDNMPLLDQYDISSITWVKGKLLIEQKQIDPVQLQQVHVFRYGPHQIIALPTWRFLQNSLFIHQMIQESHLQRINFYAPDFVEGMDALQEFTTKTFSWFVIFGDAERRIKAPSSSQNETNSVYPADFKDRSNSQNINEIVTDTLSSKQIDFLIDNWERDYIHSILGNYSYHWKEVQRDSMKERFTEGRHHLYLQGEKILAHGCEIEDIHSITQIPCLYFHQWVNKEASRSDRKWIHHQFFSQLFSHALPSMSGVALANKHSLRHCVKNGMVPVLLSVKSI